MERSKPRASADDAGSNTPLGTESENNVAITSPSRASHTKIHSTKDWQFQKNDTSPEADSQFWKNSNDILVIDTIVFMERWAQIMQRNRRKGRPLKILWQAAADEARNDIVSKLDTPFATPRIQLMAARLLRRYWVFGEELHQALGEHLESGENYTEAPIPDRPGEILY